MPFEFFDHEADVGIRIDAPSMSALFEVAAHALMDWIGEPPPERAPRCTLSIKIEASDQEELLVRWLQELLFRFQHRHVYPTEFIQLDVTRTSLNAEVRGRTWAESSFPRFREVKAVTYHQLAVTAHPEGYKASIILDI